VPSLSLQAEVRAIGLDLEAGKLAVHTSRAWAKEKASDEMIHDMLEEDLAPDDDSS